MTSIVRLLVIFLLVIGPHPNECEIKSNALERESNDPELHTDTSWKTARKRLVARNRITSLSRSRDEIIINIFDRVVANEHTIKKRQIFDQWTEDKPFNKDCSKIQC